MPEWLTTMLSVGAGGALTMASAWFADQRLNGRERERRESERRQQLADRRAGTQRETLLSLQVASQQLVRNTAASLFQDIVAHRSGSGWQKKQLPAELSDGNLRHVTDVKLLSSRVNDDLTRSLVDCLLSKVASIFLSKDEEGANALMLEIQELQGKLIERAGTLIRELDEDC